MASQGPNAPSAASNQELFLTDWTSPTNCWLSDDNYAFVTFTAFDEQSDGLRANDFGFSIPSGATIDGIVVTVERLCTEPDAVNDASAYIVKGGSTTGTNKAGGNWSDGGETASYGGAADLWGTTWTTAQINASDFGFQIQAQDNGTFGSETAYVDHITITVYYTEASTGKKLLAMGVGP